MSGMNITIFGYPKTGKTSLFNLLSGARVPVTAYEEARREPNLRTVAVPDPRLDLISGMHPEKKKVRASLDLVDLAGISFGEVKSSLLLGELRKADGLVHVVRAFSNPDIPHPKGGVDPARDIRFMEEELVLADLVLVTGRLERLEKDLKKMKDPEAEKEREVLLKVREPLESGRGLRDFPFSAAEEKLTRSFAFLSRKPLLHFVNLDETEAACACRPAERFPDIPPGLNVMAFCGRVECEIADLEDPEERQAFIQDYGLGELARERFFRSAVSLVDRLTFFTIGKDEVRAWTVRKGSSASQAAGAVHTDMEKGFIRAEVISWETLVRHGSLHAAREAGAVRLEGREYAVQDGDILQFRFGQ